MSRRNENARATAGNRLVKKKRKKEYEPKNILWQSVSTVERFVEYQYLVHCRKWSKAISPKFNQLQIPLHTISNRIHVVNPTIVGHNISVVYLINFPLWSGPFGILSTHKHTKVNPDGESNLFNYTLTFIL